MKQKVPKDSSTEPVCVGQVPLDLGLPCVFGVPSDAPLEKRGFSSPSRYLLQVASWLGVSLHPLPSSELGFLSGVKVWCSHACCTVSVSSCGHQSHCVWKGPLPGV